MHVHGRKGEPRIVEQPLKPSWGELQFAWKRLKWIKTLEIHISGTKFWAHDESFKSASSLFQVNEGQ